MRFLAVLTVKNEAAFLLEWLGHHKAVGITDFLVFSNNCDDGTDALLDRLEQMGELTHIRNDPPHEGGVQWTALKRADKHPLVQNADWIMSIDIDEFVNIHTGDHTLSDLIDALPDATAITLTWRLFGNNNIVHYNDDLITDQFTRAAPRIMNWPWRAAMFKTLYRNNGIYRKIGVHRPRSPDKTRLDQARWFDCNGRELGERFKRQQVFSAFGRDNYELAQLNHYPLGAMESYLLKRDRGRVNRDSAETGMSYWVERNWNIEEDSSINALKAPRQTNLERLKADLELGDIHANSVNWRHQKLESLLAEEPNRALLGRLMMTPQSQPLDNNSAQFLHKYAQSAPRKAD